MFYIFLFFIEFYLLFIVFIPYILYDKLQCWDTAGHWFAAWFLKSNVFPGFFGWNPYFYGGYPQNTFYPPLYHYLIVLLSYFVGSIELSLKLVNAIPTILLPLAIYYWARKYKFNRNEASLIMFLAMLPIACSIIITGVTLHSLIEIGLGSNSLVMPLFFIYFGKLKEEIDKQLESGKIVYDKQFIILVVLLTAIILSHFIVGVGTLLLTFILLGTNYSRGRLKYVFILCAITFCISAFYYVPFLFYYGFVKIRLAPISFQRLLTGPMFFIILLGMIVNVLDKDKRLDMTYLIIVFLFAVIAHTSFMGMGFSSHSYRFFIFFMILSFVFGVKLVYNNLQEKKLKIGLLVLFAFLLVIHFYKATGRDPLWGETRTTLYRYINRSLPYVESINLGSLDGKLVAHDFVDYFHPHVLPHLLARTAGVYQDKGLFNESGSNNTFYGWTHDAVVQNIGGVIINPQVKFNGRQIKKSLDLFNINYLLIQKKLDKLKPINQITVRNDLPPYFLYKINNSKLVELLPYRPLMVREGANWDEASNFWFQDIRTDNILIDSQFIPFNVSTPSDNITILEQSKTQDYLKLKVDAKLPVPILIKISYFPRFKAYVNGIRTNIYKAAPYQMLVYGNGIVELKYGPTLIDYLGWLLTFCGIGFVIYIHINKGKIPYWDKFLAENNKK